MDIDYLNKLSGPVTKGKRPRKNDSIFRNLPLNIKLENMHENKKQGRDVVSDIQSPKDKTYTEIEYH